MTVLERFLKYVKVYTTSDPNINEFPSTKRQFDLANMLADELRSLGLEAVVDDKCYVYSKLPSNAGDAEITPIGFISHMDTAPDLSGENVKPRLVENYDGSDIVLNKERGIILSPKDFDTLNNYKGKDLVVTDGNTLLGADDKAGIAEIMTAIEYFVNNPEIIHGDVMIAFTPDEEIGSGADYFDVENFGAKYAYTIDGGQIGELEYECFNANNAKVIVKGRNVHPGTAKDKMINSLEIAMEFHNLLPENEKPQYTSGYEGFFHLMKFNGCVDKTELNYIIREHDRKLFEIKKRLFAQAADFINDKYGDNTIIIEERDSYYNMGEIMKDHMNVVEVAKQAMIKNGVKPIIKPVRGGTDGSRLSFMGLPCPNIFTGGHNYHGRYEYICVQSMEKAVKVIIDIVDSYANEKL